MFKSLSQQVFRVPKARNARLITPQLSGVQFRSLSSSLLQSRQQARVIALRTQPLAIQSRRRASASSPQSAVDPAEAEAMKCLEEGTQKLEEGDVEGAKELYLRSVEIKRTASSLFNLAVTHYHLKEFDEAIAAWKESILLQPSSPDAHTNLASAYIISPVPRPELALHHLQIAISLAPEDPEIAFNLAAVLEACGRLEDSLTYYKRSHENGVERAAVHIRNVSAKILGQRAPDAETKSE